jgi:homoserine kinase
MKAARIRVPASTSNLGAAFDAVGVALQLYLTLEIRESRAQSHVEVSGQDAHLIPTDASNLIWRTMTDFAARHSAGLPPFLLRIQNEIPITKGLGSSASAHLAGAAAASFLCGLNLPADALLQYAAEREGHPDNVAPALWGGLVASISGDRIHVSRSIFPP